MLLPHSLLLLLLYVCLCAAISSKVQHHRHQEQQQVDALLSSQKYLTSNLRTLINSKCSHSWRPQLGVLIVQRDAAFPVTSLQSLVC